MFHKYLPVVKIHPIILIFMVIAFLTGMLMELSVILFIVLFHEIGHFIAAKAFGWRINHIMLWIFGGVMDTDEHGSKPLYEEAIVTVAGPVQHVIIYGFVYVSSTMDILSLSLIEIVLMYNTIILLFNLIPIWPLDGGKLLFICLCLFKPFRLSHEWTILTSMIFATLLMVIQLLYFPFTLSAFLIMIFIILENWTEWKQRYFVFIRFLLKRYDGQSSVQKVDKLVVSYESSIMDVFSEFMWDRKHAIYIEYPHKERKLLDEIDCLRSYFHEKKYDETIGNIASVPI